jgi:aldehyde dehydrogenase (NAD+)
VAKASADSVTRVSQELGGKSPNIILEDADLEAAVSTGVKAMMSNSGQSCNALTRMFVSRHQHDAAMEIAKTAAETQKVGDPRNDSSVLGPVVSQLQYDKIQALIETGIKEGATLVTGGLGRPEGLNRGYYVRPTVFGNVTHDMTISREEIFGPVLAILPYDSEEHAITMANDTVFGLSAAVASRDLEHARKVARQLRAGQVKINYPAWDVFAPFGGYKQSGNGREYADWGIHDFLEVKGIVGYGID